MEFTVGTAFGDTESRLTYRLLHVRHTRKRLEAAQESLIEKMRTQRQRRLNGHDRVRTSQNCVKCFGVRTSSDNVLYRRASVLSVVNVCHWWDISEPLHCLLMLPPFNALQIQAINHQNILYQHLGDIGKKRSPRRVVAGGGGGINV